MSLDLYLKNRYASGDTLEDILEDFNLTPLEVFEVLEAHGFIDEEIKENTECLN